MIRWIQQRLAQEKTYKLRITILKGGSLEKSEKWNKWKFYFFITFIKPCTQSFNQCNFLNFYLIL